MTARQLQTLTETADDLEHAGALVMLDDLRAVLAERTALRRALEEIRTDALRDQSFGFRPDTVADDMMEGERWDP